MELSLCSIISCIVYLTHRFLPVPVPSSMHTCKTMRRFPHYRSRALDKISSIVFCRIDEANTPAPLHPALLL